ncbi:hypothetical protein BDN72DRAFT_856370 [Pluteus cervinus]|uniref:Uncharacterized protein n=1 Tax=Pluteus cervinus TaxID=181527 RepID=A0ACD3B0U8_9AGAR|nr:hypothetical protein BDN72DRAFT_856370 [Pluteus cervinus]
MPELSYLPRTLDSLRGLLQAAGGMLNVHGFGGRDQRTEPHFQVQYALMCTCSPVYRHCTGVAESSGLKFQRNSVAITGYWRSPRFITTLKHVAINESEYVPCSFGQQYQRLLQKLHWTVEAPIHLIINVGMLTWRNLTLYDCLRATHHTLVVVQTLGQCMRMKYSL